MAKTPTMRFTGTTNTLGQVYLEGIGSVAISGYSAFDRGVGAITLAATPATTTMAPVIGNWDADTGW
jgi:hypothetical protein